MKNIFYLLFITILLAGCSKEEGTLPEPSPIGGMISVRSQEELSDEPQRAYAIQSDAITRTADNTALTYTFEAWTRDAAPRCVLHRTATGTMTEASFEIALIPGNYDFLFWADYGKAYYNTSDLRQVSLAETVYTPSNDRDAFACALENVRWEGGNGISVTLKRPLAKLTIRNTTPFTDARTVSVEYRRTPTRYDVLTGAASAPQTMTVVFPGTSAGSTLVGEDFLFVPQNSQDISLSITVGNMTKTLDALRLGPNYMTNLTATFE